MINKFRIDWAQSFPLPQNPMVQLYEQLNFWNSIWKYIRFPLFTSHKVQQILSTCCVYVYSLYTNLLLLDILFIRLLHKPFFSLSWTIKNIIDFSVKTLNLTCKPHLVISNWFLSAHVANYRREKSVSVLIKCYIEKESEHILRKFSLSKFSYLQNLFRNYSNFSKKVSRNLRNDWRNLRKFEKLEVKTSKNRPWDLPHLIKTCFYAYVSS